MKAFETFQLADFFDTLVSYSAAFIFGAAIGLERQVRHRTAGLRTNVLVSLGASAIVDLAARLADAEGATRVAASVVAGIGFLGAGVIMREGGNVRGINTAATLWCSAAVGACAGADMVAQAFLLTIFVVTGNTVLRRMFKSTSEIPLNELTAEAGYSLHITSSAGSVVEVREAVLHQLDNAHYPASEITATESGDEKVELVAKLLSISVNPEDLDALTEKIKKVSGVRDATWEVQAGA
jgi:putative Mg2+ transporter-C (MgtC) family protein